MSFTQLEGTAGASTWIYSKDDKKSTLFAQRSAGGSAFSPDGHWLAYESKETNENAVFVQPFPANGTKYQISKGVDAHHPAWSRDGKRLFFIPGPGRLVAVDISTKPSFTFSDPVQVPRGTLIEGGPSTRRNHDVTPEGNILAVVPAGSPNQSTTPLNSDIHVVLNWFTELQQRVPAK
jgi:Tol biopolymer transport system component